MSVSEIARVLGISRNTVKVAMARRSVGGGRRVRWWMGSSRGSRNCCRRIPRCRRLPSRPPRPVRHRVQFATASDWVARLADAHTTGTLQTELVRLGRYPLLAIDEVRYIPFEPEAANLFFQLDTSRYEQVSLIVTSNNPLGRSLRRRRRRHDRHRLVHHAEVIALEGDSYRLKDRNLGCIPTTATDQL
jgi:hypothetical protein